MTIGGNIRKIREHRNMTQEEFGKIAGVSSMAVSQWENDRSVPRMGAIEAISKSLHINMSEIIDGVSSKNSQPIMDMVSVPLLGKVHAGTPTEPETFDGDMVEIPKFLVDKDPDTYACKAEGDCMNRVYPEGCIIAVSPNRPPQNGSVAVVKIDGHDAVMRRMYRTRNTLVLSPDSFNPDHKDIIITSDEGHTVEFGGKVVWFQASKEME